jgi:hypothetical protein
MAVLGSHRSAATQRFMLAQLGRVGGVCWGGQRIAAVSRRRKRGGFRGRVISRDTADDLQLGGISETPHHSPCRRRFARWSASNRCGPAQRRRSRRGKYDLMLCVSPCADLLRIVKTQERLLQTVLSGDGALACFLMCWEKSRTLLGNARSQLAPVDARERIFARLCAARFRRAASKSSDYAVAADRLVIADHRELGVSASADRAVPDPTARVGGPRAYSAARRIHVAPTGRNPAKFPGTIRCRSCLDEMRVLEGGSSARARPGNCGAGRAHVRPT